MNTQENILYKFASAKGRGNLPYEGMMSTAATALCDPQIIVIGGPWGTANHMIEAIQHAFAQQPRMVPIQPALAADEPSLTGARASAIAELRTDIISRSAI